MNKILYTTPWLPVFDNDLGVWIPERWAQDALMELEPQMMASQCVHRDYSLQIAEFGDTVNVIKPGTFTGIRKTDADEVTIQNATATKIPVCLNQHVHTSFLIKDGEESKGMESMRVQYLRPAMQSIAQTLDEIVLGQVYQFLGNAVGKIGTTPTRATLIAAREKLNTNLAPFDKRRLFMTPTVEGALLNTDDFTHIDKSGDTQALKEGSLGRKFGWDMFMCQNTPSVVAPGTVITTAINLSAGYAAGATALVVDTGAAAADVLGAWCLIAGDMVPHRITAFNASTGAMTIEPGLVSAVANDAVVTIYDVGAINQTTDLGGLVTDGYPNGWVKTMAVDGFGTVPANRRMVTFGTAAAAARYALIGTPTANTIVTDRPIEAAVANDSIVAAGPIGEYCFGFRPAAMALVMRPLALPESGTGAKGYVAQYNDLGVRVVITYDGMKQGHLVTIDMLAGIKVLDNRQGVVVLA